MLKDTNIPEKRLNKFNWIFDIYVVPFNQKIYVKTRYINLLQNLAETASLLKSLKLFDFNSSDSISNMLSNSNGYASKGL